MKTRPPTVEDFWSYRELGMPLLRDTPAARRRWEGISVDEMFEQAAKQARNVGFKFGELIAELRIPEDDPSISVEPGRPQSGHRTLRVELLEKQAEQLPALVKAVNPIVRDVH